MATKHFSLYMFATLLSLLPFSSADQDLCIDQIETITDCWLHFGDPPTCKEPISSLVFCATDRLKRVLNCTQPVFDQIERMVYSYVKSEEIVCEDDNLQDEFQKKKTCWPIARNCALQLLMVTEENAGEECGDLMGTLLQSCAILSHGCIDVHAPYMEAVIQKSECKDYDHTPSNAEASVMLNLHQDDDDDDDDESKNKVPALVSNVAITIIGGLIVRFL